MKTQLTGKLCLGMVAASMSLAALANAQSETVNREYLARLYFDQMRLENQDWDIEDANYLQGAGVNALAGGQIAPRDWREVKQVTATPEELEAARTRIAYAISSGFASQQPRIFSHAIVAYDCWVGQQKAEPNASHNTSQCRDDYYKYAAMLPEPTVSKTVTTTSEVPVTIKQLHKVYFAWDRYDLTADAKSELDKARDMLLDSKNGKLIIGGYADASGSRAYNQELSRKRAQTVANYLGLTSDRYEIDVNAYGEDHLQVPTADGVREQANRVAIIGIRAVQDVTVEETKTIQVKPE